MKLPDTVLAFKLLDDVGLSEQQRQMASTVASDLKFETMRSALSKRIFSNETSANSTVEMQIKKEEDAFVSVRKRLFLNTDKNKEKANVRVHLHLKVFQSYLLPQN